MKYLASTLFAGILGSGALAQGPSIQKEGWEGQPHLHNIDPSYSKESAVIISDKRRTEYIDEGKDVAVYKTLHKVIRVNDDAGIEYFNTVYLGVSDNNDITDIRARTILPSGKVIEIDKKNIKDRKEKDGSQYKIFALEGLEKGCEIEYYYTFKRGTSFFGQEIVQGKFPVLAFNLQIISPARLGFEIKGYNGKIDPVDTTQNEKRMISAAEVNLPGVDDEKYAAHKANLARMEFKLSRNSANGGARLFTWNELAKRAYKIYSQYSDKEGSAAQKLVSSNGWEKLPSTRDKIVAVENYVKKNFTTREDISSDDAEDIEKIAKSRIASHRGITRLYGALFDKLGIDHEFVLACDRNDGVIDRDFENWNNASNYLLYFPETRKFLAPTELTLRYPWIDPYWGATNALFCKSMKIGSLATAIGEVKPVPLEDYTQSFSNVEAVVKLNPPMDTALVDISQLHAGYPASSFKAAFSLGSPENIRLFTKELIRDMTNSENVVSTNTEHATLDDFSDNKPFILHAVVKSGGLVEQAGNKVLFKVGLLIGPQSEMYQEKKRQFPIQLAYPHVLERHINLVIPAGYRVKNPGDLNFKEVYQEDGNLQFGFTSTYQLEGDTLKVHVLEEYRGVYFPLSTYDSFKKVINASADFNKVVLVLEKKD